jgi:steroid delta-isomerase-like uncharacterized protein
MSASPREVVRRLYEEFWNERRLEVADQLISQSHALTSSHIFGSTVGPTAYKLQLAMFVAGFPDLRFTVKETITENQQIVVSWIFTGTHKGEFFGVAPTNNTVSITGITTHHIADGMILDSQAMWDAIGLFQQLGVNLPIELGARDVAAT